jgi:hypothetical protein
MPGAYLRPSDQPSHSLLARCVMVMVITVRLKLVTGFCACLDLLSPVKSRVVAYTLFTAHALLR